MPLTDHWTVVTQAIVDLLTTNKVTLGLQDVFYGDQELIPRTPAAAVDASDYTRRLAGVPFRTDINFQVQIIVYHDKIQSPQLNRKECDQHCESIMDLLHQDRTLGGTVIHGFVINADPGIATRGGVLLKATRLTWEGYTKLSLPLS